MNGDLCELKAIDFECGGFQIREEEIREKRRERERESSEEFDNGPNCNPDILIQELLAKLYFEFDFFFFQGNLSFCFWD